MKMLHSYIALMRLDKPVGILLLLWPCVWGLGLASGGMPDPMLIFLFTLGAIVMRSAGCVVNDMADRKFDGSVERTKTRPLASGALSMQQASLTLALLLAIALLIVLQLPRICFYMAIAILPFVAAYPFMKRITWWPQAFLGLTFNSGALFGWAAVTGSVDMSAIALYVAGIFWTLGYDTIYAHQDKVDDVMIGVKSTALKLGKYNRVAIGIFYGITLLCLFALPLLPAPQETAEGTVLHCTTPLVMKMGGAYYLFLALAALMLAWQVITVKFDNTSNCHRRFVNNHWVGAIIAAGCVVS